MDVSELIKKYAAGERNFSGITIEYANLQGVILQGANLVGAILKEADLRQANLSQTNLSGSNLEDADLRNADLQGANLTFAVLNGASFQEANLQKATLKGAFLEQTDFRKADLKEANLQGANFKNALLDGANLTNAILSNDKPQAEEIIPEQPIQEPLAVATEYLTQMALPSQEVVATEGSRLKNFDSVIKNKPLTTEKQTSSQQNNSQQIPKTQALTPESSPQQALPFPFVESPSANQLPSPETQPLQIIGHKPDQSSTLVQAENQLLPSSESQQQETTDTPSIEVTSTESKNKQTQAQEKRSPWNLFGQRNLTDSQE